MDPVRIPSPYPGSGTWLRRLGVWGQRYGLELALGVLYGVVLVWLSGRHEIMRDEMRALGLVLESRSCWDLLQRLSSEGHPVLWYSVLSLVHAILPHAVSLKIAGLTVALGAAAVWLFRSPFTRLQKALFLFGLFPIYEYSVKPRNYGISMLLLFVLCSLYSQRWKVFPALGMIVLLLAQTNVHSLVISLALLASLGAEYTFRRARNLELPGIKATLTGFGLMVLGVGLSAAQIYPDPSILAGPTRLQWPSLLVSGLKTLWHPGLAFPHVFGPLHPILITILIWLVLVSLWDRPFILMILVLGLAGLGAVFSNIYTGFPRHQGFLYLLIIGGFWLARVEDAGELARPGHSAVFRLLSSILLTALLLLEIFIAVGPVKRDILYNYSSSRDLGAMVREDPALHDAILIGEPDYMLEAIPYYVDNPVYIVREQRFGRTIRFTSDNVSTLTLADLLQAALRIKAEHRRPVLLVIGHELDPSGPYQVQFSYGKSFTYDPASLTRFTQATRKVHEFRHAISDETYAVYEVK